MEDDRFLHNALCRGGLPGAAEMVTLDLLQGEEALQREETAPGLEPAHVFFEEIEEVSEAGLNSGFIFFDEEAS